MKQKINLTRVLKHINLTVFCFLFSLCSSSITFANSGNFQNEKALLDSFAHAILNGDAIEINEKQLTSFPVQARALNAISEKNYTFYQLMQMHKLVVDHLQKNETDIPKFEYLANSIDKKYTPDYLDYLYQLTVTYRNAFNLPKADSVISILIQEKRHFKGDILKKANSYLLIHNCVISAIKGEIDSAFAQGGRSIRIAENIKDTNLVIECKYYLSDIYIRKRDLSGFLDLMKSAYQLDSLRSQKSDFQPSIIRSWLDGLLFQSKDFNRIDQLLDEYEKVAGFNAEIVRLKLNYWGSLPEEHPILQREYDNYGAENFIQLIGVLDSICKENLLSTDYSYFLESASTVLFEKGHYNDALEYMQNSKREIEKVYSEKLSQDLAKIEGEKVKREKDIEIAAEQAKNQIFLISTVAAILLAAVILITLINIRKQAQKLRIKNNEIENQRAALEKADGEKALLIKEIHHRVKNNFQVVSSLLELQSRGIEDVKAKELAQEGQNRVKSMALIHQRLYQNEDLLISFDEYTRALVNEIAAMYDKEVDVDIKAEKFAFDVDTAVPLGLILNELITNAFKYAIDENNKSLKIHFEKLDDSYKMVVKDNGKGIDPNFDLKRTKSLGLKLVNRLSQQLKGKAEILNEEGAAFAIYFKDTEMRKRSN